MLHTRGQVEEAIDLYRQIYTDPKADARLQATCCATIMAAANDLGSFNLADQALADALRITDAAPDSAGCLERIYSAYAESLYLRAQFAPAVVWYRKGLRHLEDPCGPARSAAERTGAMAFVWYGLAKVHTELGDLVRARFAIQGINASGSRRTIRTLEALAEGRLHLRNGALSRAEAWLERAKSTTTDLELRQEALLLQAMLFRSCNQTRQLQTVLRDLSAYPFLKYEFRREIASFIEAEAER